MESFGADPGAPLDVCRQKVQQAELVVVIVAHRYGWVPTAREGGDDYRSITWHEVEAAGGRPVFVYLVDPAYEWPHGRETDRVAEARSPEEAVAVWKNVLALRELRSFLSDKRVRSTFTSAENLATQVVADVSRWVIEHHASPRAPLDRADVQVVVGSFRDAVERLDADRGFREFWQRWERDRRRVTPEDAIDALTEVLRLCRTAFGVRSERVVLVADALLDVAPANGEAWLARGVAIAGAIRKQAEAEAAAGGVSEPLLMRSAEARDALVRATELLPDDPDAWGSLGGHLKRMADWAGSAEEGARLSERMLASYWRGAQLTDHAYPLLNFIEERAVREPTQPLVRGPEERRRLQKALARRAAQYQKQVDAPWAAFDVARGYHYLEPNLARFLSDLQAGIRDARRVAPLLDDPDDPWMLRTAEESLVRLKKAQVPVRGLDEGIALLRNAAASGRWLARDEAALRTTDAVEKAVLELRLELGRLGTKGDTSRAELLAAVEKLAAEPITEAELQQFEAHAGELGGVPADGERRELALALWKIGGKEGLKTLAGFIPVPGAGPLVSMLLEAIELFVERKKKK